MYASKCRMCSRLCSGCCFKVETDDFSLAFPAGINVCAALEKTARFYRQDRLSVFLRDAANNNTGQNMSFFIVCHEDVKAATHAHT